ncbi:hypothetical protein [Streptomyces sp. NPDC020607]|uniref:hypothetical protein n=1 Tax=Streptomyces sp. NPDC020607 TaxID=3365082 RepID=UPI0037BDF30C
MSPKTASVHVSDILPELNASGRGEAAAPLGARVVTPPPGPPPPVAPPSPGS